MAANQTDLERKAGIASFEKFKHFNTINSLAGGDVLKWAEIANLPYQTVFIKQLMNKVENAYNKKFAELIAANK